MVHIIVVLGGKFKMNKSRSNTRYWSKKRGSGSIKIEKGRIPSYGPGRFDVQENRIEQQMAKAVRRAVKKQLMEGHPVARFDLELQKPYLEYPDGTRLYEEIS